MPDSNNSILLTAISLLLRNIDWLMILRFYFERTLTQTSLLQLLPAVRAALWWLCGHASYSLWVSMVTCDRGLESHTSHRGKCERDSDGPHCDVWAALRNENMSGVVSVYCRTQRLSRPLAQPSITDIFLFRAQNQPTKYHTFLSSTSSIQPLVSVYLHAVPE